MSCWEGTAVSAVNMGMSRGVHPAIAYMKLRVKPAATAELRIPASIFAIKLQRSRCVKIEWTVQGWVKKKQYSPLLGS